jgi:mannose-6-phosphate isomerase-like protein (cupin superfamily)
MKSFLALAILAFTSASIHAAEQPQKNSVLYFDREKVSAAIASGGPLLITNNFKVQTGRRTGPGEVEIHERDTDVFYILEGTATFVTGGRAVEPRTISAGEIRAKEITGGEERKLAKGDVIVIPRGVPHWFKQVEGTFVYFVVKVVEEKGKGIAK